MGITEQEIHLLAEVERSVEDCYHHFTDLAHGFEHVQRVYHLVLFLAEQEQADDLSQERQQAILHAILAHSYRHGTRTATLEARAV
jgi:HD superfamily phosphodiesterase